MLLTLHFDWMYGFLSFCLGMPILLWGLGRLASALNDEIKPAATARRPTRSTWLADAIIWWFVVLSHTLLFAFGLASLAVWVAMPHGPRRARLVRALAVLPAAVWLLASLRASRTALDAAAPAGLARGLEALWEGPAAKWADVGRSLIVARVPGLLAWGILTGLALFVIAALVSERRAHRVLLPGARWLRGVALLAVIAYAALPYSIYDRGWVTCGLFILYQRFMILAPLVLLPTLAWPEEQRRRIALAAVVLGANVALACDWYALFARVGRQARGLDAAIVTIPPGKILKSLVYTPYPEGCRFESFLHAGSWYQARALGETDQSFALLPSNPVHYRDPSRPYLSRNDEHLRPQEFDLRQAERFDAILVYDRSGEWLSPASAPSHAASRPPRCAATLRASPRRAPRRLRAARTRPCSCRPGRWSRRPSTPRRPPAAYRARLAP
jgi:hypothetical protein